MKILAVDILLSIAGLALLAAILHDPSETLGAVKTVTGTFKQGIQDIRS